MRILGVITARGGSKGVPKKNIIDVCGKPLIAYSIHAAMESESLTDFIVSTDSHEIAEIATNLGATVPFIRPEILSGDTASSYAVLLHALEFMEKERSVKYDAVMLLQPTTPLRTAATIDAAINKMRSSDCDSVVTVVDVGANHPFRMYTLGESNRLMQLLEAVEDPMMPRQKLPKVYIRSGDVYITRRECLLNKSSIIGVKSEGIEIDPSDTINIDTFEDLIIARHRIKTRLEA